MKGKKQSALTKRKISLANTKDRTELYEAINTYIEGLTEDDFPSIVSCALQAGVSEYTLLAHEATTEENSEIRQLLDIIRDKQKESLTVNGLKKNFDGRLTLALLKAHHNLKEEPTSLTQNNIFNMSPEILADALALSKNK